MQILDSITITLLKSLQYKPSLGTFPIILEHSQEIFSLEPNFIKSEVLNCRPVTLEKRDCFAKDFFFEIAEILEHLFLSWHFQKNIFGRIFSPLLACRMQPCNFTKLGTLPCVFFWVFSKIFGAAVSKYSQESICHGVQ